MEGRMLQQGSREEIARAEHCATWSCREHVQSKEQAGKKGPKSMESERGKDPLKTVGWYHLKEKMGAAKEHLVNPCFPENLGTELDDGRCAGTEEISHPLSSLGCLFDGPGSQRIQDFCIKWAWLALSPLLVPVLWVSALRKMPHFFQWKTGEQDHCLGFSQLRGAWTFTALYLCWHLLRAARPGEAPTPADTGCCASHA